MRRIMQLGIMMLLTMALLLAGCGPGEPEPFGPEPGDDPMGPEPGDEPTTEPIPEPGDDPEGMEPIPEMP